MKNIKAVIVYPVDVVISVPEHSDSDFIWKELVSAGDKEVSSASVAPVIHSCSDDSFVTHGMKITNISPESQSEFIQAAIEGLIMSRTNISSAIIARPFLLNLKSRDGKSLVDKISILSALNKEVIDDILSATNPIKHPNED